MPVQETTSFRPHWNSQLGEDCPSSGLQKDWKSTFLFQWQWYLNLLGVCEFAFRLDCMALLFQLDCEHMERCHLNIGKVKHRGNKSPSSNAHVTLLGGTKWKFSQFHTKSIIFILKTIQIIIKQTPLKHMTLGAWALELIFSSYRIKGVQMKANLATNAVIHYLNEYINSWITIFTKFSR